MPGVLQHETGCWSQPCMCAVRRIRDLEGERDEARAALVEFGPELDDPRLSEKQEARLRKALAGGEGEK